jgi:hypothetical protein
LDTTKKNPEVKPPRVNAKTVGCGPNVPRRQNVLQHGLYGSCMSRTDEGSLGGINVFAGNKIV